MSETTRKGEVILFLLCGASALIVCLSAFSLNVKAPFLLAASPSLFLPEFHRIAYGSPPSSDKALFYRLIGILSVAITIIVNLVMKNS